MKLNFEPFRLDTCVFDHLASFIIKDGEGDNLDSNIEPERDGLCDWLYFYNRKSAESIGLNWHGSYYELKIESTNPKLEAQVASFIKELYQKVKTSPSWLIESYAREGNLSKVKTLYKKGDNISRIITFACEEGHNQIINHFLNIPSFLKGFSKGLANGLIAASDRQHLETVKLILKNKVKIKPRRFKWSLTLSLAEAAGIGNLEIITLLLENGAEVVIDGDEYYTTALHEAARMNRKEVMIKLLEYTDDEIEPNNENGCTPSEWAWNYENKEIWQILSEKFYPKK